MLVSMCLLNSNLNAHTKPEKLKPSRDITGIINDCCTERVENIDIKLTFKSASKG
jgi:hypothetical protein